jgi:hypothetical protein
MRVAEEANSMALEIRAANRYGPLTEERLARLAGSFTEFLGSLTGLPPGDRAAWLVVE